MILKYKMIGLNKVHGFAIWFMVLSYDWMEGGDNKGGCDR
jgi:hypothetical protein